MVKARLALEPEVQQIFETIDEGKNFLLSGGAGSGKTYSLVQVIAQAIFENPTSKIACMTYTNAAVREINARFDSENLFVSTIHDFLWDNIKSFQNELKIALVELANDENVKVIKTQEDNLTLEIFSDADIQYKEYTSIKNGIISHDEILVLSEYMFKKYKKLSDILNDKYKFILVDEYQDTSPYVVKIFLEHLCKSTKSNIVGFFGDSMQSIYEDSVGNLNEYITSGKVFEIKKEQNRRNPKLVFDLANKLRTDGIVQIPSNDKLAPNMENGVIKDGSISFYYSADSIKLEELRTILNWDWQSKETKELNLTHNLIAPRAGFEKLMQIYDGDKILDYKKRIKDYIQKNNIQDDFSDLTFGQVIDKLLEGKTTDSQKKPILPTDGMQEFINSNPTLFESAKNYKYQDFVKIYVDKDSLLDDKKDDAEDESRTASKRDHLIKHLFKIQLNIKLYTDGKFNDFLRRTEFKIASIADKRKLLGVITNLQQMSKKKISEVIDFADENGICKIDDKIISFKEKNKYIYDQVVDLEFNEFEKLFNYLEGYTPFSTQHKIKGAEFDNVLVILDNGNWSSYNFEYLFNQDLFDSLPSSKKNSFPRILERTQKIFYVCCTRAKKNLVVYYHNPSESVVETARQWFGQDNVKLVS